MKGSFIKALPIVAKALSENYGVSLAIYGNQAKTDGKRIVLPVLPEDDHKATVLARGYLDHESAHIRFTDFELINQSGFEKALTNILEDVRIEQAMSQKYPGCRENLHALARLLVAEGDFKPSEATDPPAKVVQSYLLHYLRARILNQQALEPLANQDQVIFDCIFPGLRAKLEPIGLEVRDAADTRTVRDLARRIAELFQEAAQPSPAESGSENQDDPDQDGGDNVASHSQAETSPDENEEQLDSSSESQTEGEGDEQENGDQNNSSDSEQSEDKGDDVDQSDANLVDGEEDDDVSPDSSPDDSGQSSSSEANEGDQSRSPGNTQDEDLQPGEQTGDVQVSRRGAPGSQSGGLLAAAQALADENAYHDLAQTVAEKLNAISPKEGGLEMAREIPPWWQNAEPLKEQELLQATARLRAMLAGVVQSKRSKRSRVSLSGTKLDVRNLHRLAVNDGRVFLTREERTGVNTAVYLLMDQSGSMSYTAIKTAFMGTAALARALRSIPGTAVAAGAFSSKRFKGEDDDRAYVASLLKFDENERRMNLVIPPSESSTPMAEAMYCVAAKLLLRPEPRRLLVVLTDGIPNDYRATQEVIRNCRSAGMEVYGVGIMDSSVKPLFGKEFAIVVNTIGELPDQLFRLLANRL